MAALSAASVTYTMKIQRKGFDSRNANNVQLTFGDGVQTYPAGGIPLTIGNLGCPSALESFDIIDQGTSGYQFKVDLTNLKLIMVHSGAHSHSLLLKNAVVADGASTSVNAGTNLLGANTGSDITVAGAGANGGVQNTTIGAMTEPTGVAIAAQTLIVEVIGW